MILGIFDNFKTLKQHLELNFETLIKEWFSNGHREGNYIKVGDFADNKGESLVIDLNKKIATDFSCGITAKDVIEIYRYRFNLSSNYDALIELIDKYNLNYLFNNSNNNTNTNNNNNNNYNSGGQNGFSNRYTKSNINLHNNSHISSTTIERDKDIKRMLNGIKRYEPGDMVDLYLKSRGINKYCDDCYIYTDEWNNVCMVNLCNEVIKNSLEEVERTNKTFKRTNKVIGLQRTYLHLTKDENGNNCFSKEKKQLGNIRGNPVVLESTSNKNDEIIYICEGIETGLSLREYINNEIWCSLSIANIPNLPFENDKVYVFVLDNDYQKTVQKSYKVELKDELKRLGVDYKKEKIENSIEQKIIYNHGEYLFKNLINTLEKQSDKHMFYLIPKEPGKDANDLLKESKLGEFLEQPPTPINIKTTIKVNKRTKQTEYWLPEKQNIIKNIEADKLSFEFAKEGLKFSDEDIAKRFIIRYGDKYRKIAGVSIVKYNDTHGTYNISKDNDGGDLQGDISKTIALLIFEYNYLTNLEDIKDFKQIYTTKSKDKLINEVKNYLKNSNMLSTSNANELDASNELNFNNCYYNLDEDKAYEHNKDKLFTKRIETNFNKDYKPTDNSIWNKTLKSIFLKDDNDQEGLNKLHEFHKVMGYAISNKISLQKIIFLTGSGCNGKSLIIESIMRAMGSDYSGGSIDDDFLTNYSQSSNLLMEIRADNRGKRLTHISELSMDNKINSKAFKRLTDSLVKAKYLYSHAFTYTNTCKYIVTTNELSFSNLDKATLRRIMVFRLNNTFYPAGSKEAIETGRVIDPYLSEKLSTPQSIQDIIHWLIEGYRLFKAEGINETNDMKKALENLEEENNTLSVVVKDNIKQYDSNTQEIKDTRKTCHDLYLTYVDYEINTLHTHEDRIITYNVFLKRLRAMGFDVNRIWNNRTQKKEYYLNGWCLKDEVIIEKTKETKTKKEVA